jgi:hypothetical protein
MSGTVAECESERVCHPDLPESRLTQHDGDANAGAEQSVVASESHLAPSSEPSSQV